MAMLGQLGYGRSRMSNLDSMPGDTCCVTPRPTESHLVPLRLDFLTSEMTRSDEVTGSAPVRNGREAADMSPSHARTQRGHGAHATSLCPHGRRGLPSAGRRQSRQDLRKRTQHGPRGQGESTGFLSNLRLEARHFKNRDSHISDFQK